jgi:hypothetical protein
MVIFELARLQVEERQREMERRSLATLARRNRSHTPKQSMLQRLARSRRHASAEAA